ncbi:putative ATP synthase subunit f-like protein [Dinothrombium tinctorium]|uniref:Putative ATP synthase subunit f-like protein n=1 Tax=Dinothrombium tinctorium TaxID=1965070 RepID=A0A443QN67_9ACAR|nr:putative ATP synthase subunit f-like protein [Dinothrombium tinctorium]
MHFFGLHGGTSSSEKTVPKRRRPLSDIFGGIKSKAKMDAIKTWYKSLGCYPQEYNRAVHGPYDAGRYYGPKDTPFWDVKLSEMPAWLGRRHYDPRSVFAAISRARIRWFEKYNLPMKAKSTYFLQLAFLTFVFFYTINYKTTRHHKNYKYHW